MNSALDDMIEHTENRIAMCEGRLAIAEFQTDREELRDLVAYYTGVLSGLRQARLASGVGA